MFGTYLVRELVNRRKQTLIVAIGLGLAIALVILVNSIAAGVRDAQAGVLQSIYGVGTDITISQTPATPEEGGAVAGPPAFEFGSDDGTTADGTTALSQSRLETDRTTTTFDATALDTVLSLDGVSGAAASLSLTNSTFSGELPDFTQAAAPGEGQAPPTGGADGAGGSAFSIDSFTVEGVDLTGDAVGPLTSTTVVDGRALEVSDTGTNVVVLDETWATTQDYAVGDTVVIGSTDFEVVGIVGSGSSDVTTAANTYISLDVAQALAGLDGQISTISVQATSASDIAGLQTELEAALPDATVNTQADLAASVSGSLGTASTLVANLGTWLSLVVLAAAFLLAVLFTISGVSRRTREFGTLKAIGWSNRRIVGQVAGESLAQGLLGGVIGIALGVAGGLIVTAIGPTLEASAQTATGAGPGGAGFPGGGGFPGGPGDAAVASTTEIVLGAPLSLTIILIAVGLAVLGGLLAGAIGGWRAARLRPAEALRSVA
jgi:putative ABC transport system permease protein